MLDLGHLLPNAKHEAEFDVSDSFDAHCSSDVFRYWRLMLGQGQLLPNAKCDSSVEEFPCFKTHPLQYAGTGT